MKFRLICRLITFRFVVVLIPGDFLRGQVLTFCKTRLQSVRVTWHQPQFLCCLLLVYLSHFEKNYSDNTQRGSSMLKFFREMLVGNSAKDIEASKLTINGDKW
jgi:hypothetical protein